MVELHWAFWLQIFQIFQYLVKIWNTEEKAKDRITGTTIEWQETEISSALKLCYFVHSTNAESLKYKNHRIIES